MEKSKPCQVCGRIIEPRKKWKLIWGEIKYCSDRCRGNKNGPSYEDQILQLLRERGRGKTICPSEVLVGEEKANKELMERVRQSARRLVNQGQIVITQQGREVDPSTAKGPIRLKLVEKGK